MLTVGLTGGIGSGKTTVSNMFEDLGARIIDTDVIARELVNNDTSVLTEIVDAFGQSILLKDGTLDRKQLAQIVFSQKNQKRKLENILHPRIRSEVTTKIKSLSANAAPSQYIIVVIPLLFETGFIDIVDRILVVLSDEAIRIERVMQRDHRDVDEIRSIIKNQVSEQIRISGADDIIENNNDIKVLEQQVNQLHVKYKTLSTAAK